jgi:hypothetical protein
MDDPTNDQPIYEIRVGAVLDRGWASWFAGLSISDGAGGSVIRGPVVDQAALHGLLAKVRDLGLPLLAVRDWAPHTHTRRPTRSGSTPSPTASTTPAPSLCGITRG